MSQVEEKIINIRGVDHYYEWIRQSDDSHSKPVMVFLHGWGGSGRYWRTTAEQLCDRFDCLLYDLRGFGRSKLPPTPLNIAYEMEDYAEDLSILLDQLGLEKVYLNSHSMGASIAAIFLTLYPQKVEQAILTCNGIFEYDEKAFTTFHKFGKYVVQFRYPWFVYIPFIERMFMARFLCRSIDVKEQKAFLEDFILADYEAALETIYTSVSKKAVEIMPKKFAMIEVPTLMVSGEKDQIIPAKMGAAAASLNDKIKYVEISQTSHFPMLEDPGTYLNCVRDFLGIN